MNPALPLRQRAFLRQRFQASLPQRETTTHLLWHQCPLPKWHCRALHPQPLGERTQTTAPRTRSLATGSTLHPMAICFAQRRSPPQQSASAGGWHIKARAFQLNSSWKQHEACAHLWLPSVRIAKRTCVRQIFAKMVTSRSPWAQSRTKPNARKERLPGTQLIYRMCLTSVSLSL